MGSTPQRSLPDGSSLGTDRFVIERQLGEGSMGAVYLAFDRERRARVALKTLRRVDASGIYRFKREFRALADVSHPNLVALHELFSEGADWFFTMEYIEGKDFIRYALGEVYRPHDLSPHRTRELHLGGGTRAKGMEVLFPSPLKEPERARHVLSQVTLGLMALHGAGKLHRDLKSDNVLVTDEGRAVILDFGIAFEVNQDKNSTLEGGVFGTPAYMSPEQAGGLPLSEATDWYSLGVMLYEALTGHVPFDGSYVDVMRQKQSVDPPAPSELVSEIPAELDTLCMTLLARDPAARPAGDAILRALGGERARESDTAVRLRGDSQPPLLGRGEELRVLERALRSTDEGAPVMLLLHGQTGMGKTRLVERFQEGLHERDETVVLSGRCYEHETVPYKALDSVVDALSRYLGRLGAAAAAEVMPIDVRALSHVFPVLERVETVRRARRRSGLPRNPQELRRRAAGALREMLFRIAARQRLVVCIDDLQWGDVDSARLLAELLRGAQRPAMLLLCTYREEDADRSPCLRALFAQLGERTEPAVRRLRIEALDDADGLALARALLGADDDGRAQAVAREARGNPYLLTELVEHVLEEAHGKTAESGPSDAADNPRVSLDLALAERLERLDRDALTILELVSVSGSPVREELVAELLPPTLDLAAALLQLRREKLVRGVSVAESRAIEVYHDHVREAVLTRMEYPRVEAWHRRLASTLEASGTPDLEALTAHLLGARDYQRAGIYAIRAAAAAKESLAFDKAAELYAVAIEHHADEAWRHELMLQRADALISAGRSVQAAEVLLEAAKTAGEEEAVELRRRAGVQLLVSGRWERGVEAVSPAAAKLGIRFPTDEREAMATASVLWQALRERGFDFELRDEETIPQRQLARLDALWSIIQGTLSANPVTCLVFALRHSLDALDAGEPKRIVRGLCTQFMTADLPYAATATGKPQSLQLAETMVRDIDDAYTLAWVDLARSFSYQTRGLLAPASLHLMQAEELFRSQCEGATAEMRATRVLQARLWVMMARFDDLAQCDAWIREAEEGEDLLTATRLRLIGTQRALLNDDTERAGRMAGPLPAELWSDRLGLTTLLQGLSRSQLALYENDRAAGKALLESAYVEVSPLLVIPLWRADHLASSARLHLLASLECRSEAGFSRVERATAAIEALSLECYVDHTRVLRAALAERRGDRDQALDMLDAVITDAHMGGDSHLLRASAMLRRGELMGGRPGEELAAQALTELAAQGIADPRRFARLYIPELT